VLLNEPVQGYVVLKLNVAEGQAGALFTITEVPESEQPRHTPPSDPHVISAWESSWSWKEMPGSHVSVSHSTHPPRGEHMGAGKS
jgi:hypothetical protein